MITVQDLGKERRFRWLVLDGKEPVCKFIDNSEAHKDCERRQMQINERSMTRYRRIRVLN